MEVMRITNEKWEKVVKDLHFVPLAQIGNSFLFFGCKPKKKKHLSLICVHPRKSVSNALLL